MITVVLLDRQNAEVAKLQIQPERIADAACVIWNGRHFIYGGMEGRFFSNVKFVECNPPVDISKFEWR